MDVMKSERVMRRLFEISTEHEQGFPAQVQAMLELGCGQFDLKIGILSRILDDVFKLEHLCSPPSETLSPGAVLPLSETMASVALEAGQAVGISDLGDSPFDHYEACNRWGLQAYLGAPVLVEGEVYGTLSFSCFEPRALPFSASELELIQLMASWLGMEIQRQLAHERLKKAEESFRLGVEASPASMIMVDGGGRITFANTRAQELFGYRLADLLGASVELLVPEAAREKHPALREKFKLEGGVAVHEQGPSSGGYSQQWEPFAH